MRLVPPLGTIVEAAKHEDLDQIKATLFLVAPLIVEAKQAIQNKDFLKSKELALRLGIVGINTTFQEVVELIQKGIDVINLLIDFSVNGKNKVETELNLPAFPVSPTPPFEFYPPATINFSLSLPVSFRGLEFGSNDQPFTPEVHLSVTGDQAIPASVALRVKSAGLRQDEVDVKLITGNLIGVLAGGPFITEGVSTPTLAAEIWRRQEFIFTPLSQVDLRDSRPAKIDYGIDGFCRAISAEAEASVVVRNTPYRLKLTIEKFGISV